MRSTPMHSIPPSVDNAFLFWTGDPAGKLDQINAALHSLSRHNPDMQIYLFTNDLNVDDLHEEVARTCPLSIVNWTVDELVEDTPFADRARELHPSFLKERGAKVNWRIVFSNFFRYVVLLRWGGTYVDLDTISVRPMTRNINAVPSTIARSSRHEEGWGDVARDRSCSWEPYTRLNTNPLIRFEPGHQFMKKCLEVALTWPPDLSGSKVLTEVYGQGDAPPSLTVRSDIDMLLHPDRSLVAYVARHCGWGEKWWWSQLEEEEFQTRWVWLLRLGAFALVKNHAWAVHHAGAAQRMLSGWVHHLEIEAMEAMESAAVPESGTGVTVVIPTHRPRFLADTLDALLGQTDRSFDVVVVENGVRQAGTEDLVRGFEDALNVRYVFEERIGLNVARNAGCGLARGSIIALLDDDCIPRPDWIGSIRGQFKNNPDAWVIAGRVTLRFRAPRPGWVTGEFRSLLSEMDIAAGDASSNENYWVTGANFSFRKEAFRMAGGFDEEVGMIGKSGPQFCHDETEFCRRVEDLTNTKIKYSREIAVEHQVPAERLQVDFFEQRRYGQGVSDIGLILDRERRAASDALEKLERQLYDTGWLGKLKSACGSVDGESGELILVNTIRTRVEYISGLAVACLKAIPQDTMLRKALARYENKARKAADCWRRRQTGVEEGLIDLAQLMVDSAVRKPANHYHYTRPAIMLGRAAFFRTLKRELVAPAN